MDIWAAIAEERESLIDTLEELSPEQWATPSLCGEWTVHEVLGHLVVAASPPRGSVVLETLKVRGSFDRANDLLAREQAERPPPELLTTYRGLVTKRFKPPGFGPESTLAGILLHSLDIRIPLGLPTKRPVERYAPAIELYFTHREQRILGPRGRPIVHWVATDLVAGLWNVQAHLRPPRGQSTDVAAGSQMCARSWSAVPVVWPRSRVPTIRVNNEGMGMSDDSDETIVLEADKVFRWEGPKRKQTLFKAKLGRLVLTDRRLLFLSTGKNDLSVGKLAGAAVSPLLGLRTSSTGDLDLSAATADGGLDVPRERLRGGELKGMFKTMTVTWIDEAGTEQVSTFAPKNGSMPDGAAWVAEIPRSAPGAG